MSDADRILEYLKRHGSITSYEIRVKGLSGNPSQRITELEDRGHVIDTERFQRDGRPCCTYTLVSTVSESGGDRSVSLAEAGSHPQQSSDAGVGLSGPAPASLPQPAAPTLFEVEEPKVGPGHIDVDQRDAA